MSDAHFRWHNAVLKSDVTHRAARVAGYLFARSGTDLEVYPSLKAIASGCNMSVRSVQYVLAELVEKGWVTRAIRQGPVTYDKRNKVNVYCLTVPQGVNAMTSRSRAGDDTTFTSFDPQETTPRSCLAIQGTTPSTRRGRHSVHPEQPLEQPEYNTPPPNVSSVSKRAPENEQTGGGGGATATMEKSAPAPMADERLKTARDELHAADSVTRTLLQRTHVTIAAMRWALHDAKARGARKPEGAAIKELKAATDEDLDRWSTKWHDNQRPRQPQALSGEEAAERRKEENTVAQNNAARVILADYTDDETDAVLEELKTEGRLNGHYVERWSVGHFKPEVARRLDQERYEQLFSVELEQDNAAATVDDNNVNERTQTND